MQLAQDAIMKLTQKWFDHILNSQWVSVENNKLIQPQRNSDGIWTLGDIITNDQEILEACPRYDISNIQEFYLIHDAWKATLFKIYRPLIYFCAFDKESIFECAYAAIESLIEFGKWQHDIAIFTAQETKDKLSEILAPLTLNNNLHIISVKVTEKLDWYTIRYQISSHPLFQKAQPLLYLDTDMICDAPIDELLISLINSPYIHACKEGVISEGNPAGDGWWYGSGLMRDDNVQFNPNARAFSSGALFFSNINIAQPFFEMIRKSAYGFIKKNGYNGFSYDQRFANYILFKYNKVEINMMVPWLYLYRIPRDTTLMPSGQEKRGLVHFLNASTENKLITMKKYIEDLRFRAEQNL